MKRFLAAVRAIAILLVSWAVLVGIGYGAGVFPPKPDRTAREGRGEPIGSPSAASGGTEASAPLVPTPVPPGVPAPVPPRTAEPAPSAPIAEAPAAAVVAEALPKLARYAACGGSFEPSIGTLAQRTGERPLLFLGCGGTGDVVGFAGDRPLRVARVTVPVGATAPAVRKLRAIAADTTGDGVLDWIFGTLRSSAVGAPQTGSVHLVRGDGRGSFEPPIALAPLAVADLAAAPLDGDAALDLVVLHQPDAAGRRASEAWIFRGGPSLVRSAKLPTSGTATSIGLLPLDGDDATDLLVGGIGVPSLRAHYADGSGRYPRTATIAAPATSAIGLGDVDGDGAIDALVASSGVRLVRGHGDVDATATAIEGIPELRSMRVLDFDGDGDPDVVGISPNADVVLARRGSDGTYALETLLALPRESGRVVDVFAADLAFGTAPELVVLVERDPSSHEREWMVWPDVASAVSPRLADVATTVPDAPLSLSIELH